MVEFDNCHFYHWTIRGGPCCLQNSFAQGLCPIRALRWEKILLANWLMAIFFGRQCQFLVARWLLEFCFWSPVPFLVARNIFSIVLHLMEWDIKNKIGRSGENFNLLTAHIPQLSFFVYLLSQNATSSASNALTLLGYAKDFSLLHSVLNRPNLQIRFFQSIHPSIHGAVLWEKKLSANWLLEISFGQQWHFSGASWLLDCFLFGGGHQCHFWLP